MDTLVAVVILFFLTSTIIPLTFNMKQQILKQQQHMHAAEVAFNGALKYKRYGEFTGEQQIDETSYYWIVQEGGICVRYEFAGIDEEFCV